MIWRHIYSVLRTNGHNWSNFESCLSPLPDRILNQKEKHSKWQKVKILSEKFAISGSFDEKLSKMGKKWPWSRTHEQKGCHVKTIEQLIFPPKDFQYNLTKSHQVSAASANYSRGSRWKTRWGSPRGRSGICPPLAIPICQKVWPVQTNLVSKSKF